MKTMTKIKIKRLNRRFNDWVLNNLCYPINKLERKLISLQKKDKRIYNTLEVFEDQIILKSQNTDNQKLVIFK